MIKEEDLQDISRALTHMLYRNVPLVEEHGIRPEKSNYNARLRCQKTLKNSGFWHLCANYIRRVTLKLNKNQTTHCVIALLVIRYRKNELGCIYGYSN